LLKPEDRESVSGDLLEEYRETIVPTLGPAADRWYVRQVASFLLRASVLTYTIMAACLLTGFSTAWRGRSMRAGIVISLSGATIGATLGFGGALFGKGMAVASRSR
jgi:hypothetical protein